jgi:replicative DNA helicase
MTTPTPKIRSKAVTGVVRSAEIAEPNAYVANGSVANLSSASLQRGRYVPVDADAEAGVLSALLTSPDAYADVVERIGPEDFGLAGHQAIMAAIVAVDSAMKPVDQITVADQMRKDKTLKLIGGTATLEALAALAADVTNPVAYAEIVADKARKRRLATAGAEISAAALDPGTDGLQATELAESRVFALGEKRGRSSLTSLAHTVPQAMAEIANGRKSLLVGHPTGFRELDRMTGGFAEGQLWVLAARPGIGKSALAAQIAANVAQTSGPVLFCSYEMSKEELTMRLLAARSGIDLARLRRNDIPEGSERDLAVHANALAQLPLHLDDNPPETIGGVRAMARRFARRGAPALIVVDYLQLMNADQRRKDDSRAQEVAEISRGLKRLATELGNGCAVLALSQLNRKLEERTNKRPMLSDLKDSGAVEQDANVVLMLHREGVFEASHDQSAAELIIAKQRSGPTGTVPLLWQPGQGARYADAPVGYVAPAATRGTRPFGDRSSTNNPF